MRLLSISIMFICVVCLSSEKFPRSYKDTTKTDMTVASSYSSSSIMFHFSSNGTVGGRLV